MKFIFTAILWTPLLFAQEIAPAYKHLVEYPTSPLPQVQSSVVFNEIATIQQNGFGCLNNDAKASNTTRVVLLRHAQSKSNFNKGIAGRTDDSDLSEPSELPSGVKSGVEQAEECAERFFNHQISFDGVYSSPMMRAKRTVEIILDKIGLRDICIKEDPLLHEKYYGVFEGATEAQYLPIKEAEAKYNCGPDLSFDQKFKFKADEKIESLSNDQRLMESMHDVQIRLVQFLERMHFEHRGKTLLVGTHNALLKGCFMVDTVQRFALDLEYRDFDVNNCSIIVIEITDSDMRIIGTHGLKYRK